MGIALGLIVALAFAATVALGDPAPRPLVLTDISSSDQATPPELLDFGVRNTGDVVVDVIAASVRGIDDSTMMARRVRIAAQDSGTLPIRVPARCPGMPTYETIDLRIVVAGRETSQTLDTQAPVQTCP